MSPWTGRFGTMIFKLARCLASAIPDMALGLLPLVALMLLAIVAFRLHQALSLWSEIVRPA